MIADTHTHTHEGLLCVSIIFFLSLPLRRFVCAPLHANTHREWHNYFTLYPPQYEITAYRHVLQCTLVMKVNAGWRGIRGREYGGKRCKKKIVRTLSLWHFHTKNLLWCLQHDCMLWSMNLSAHVWLCDMCLFLDEAIRGNYNATVSTASFASLCSSSCTMRGKQWCFFFLSPQLSLFLLSGISSWLQRATSQWHLSTAEGVTLPPGDWDRRERQQKESWLGECWVMTGKQGTFFLLSFHDCSLLLEAIAMKTVEVNNSDDLLVRKLWFLS